MQKQFLQSILQLRSERVTQKQTLKIKAYTDYLQSAAALSSKDVSKQNEARTLLTDARLRILIYGSAKVIENIAIFDRTGAHLHATEGMKTFLPVIIDARRQLKREDQKRKTCLKSCSTWTDSIRGSTLARGTNNVCLSDRYKSTLKQIRNNRILPLRSLKKLLWLSAMA